MEYVNELIIVIIQGKIYKANVYFIQTMKKLMWAVKKMMNQIMNQRMKQINLQNLLMRSEQVD